LGTLNEFNLITFPEVSMQSKESKRSCMFVGSINFATFFDFSIGFWNNTDSETLPTVW